MQRVHVLVLVLVLGFSLVQSQGFQDITSDRRAKSFSNWVRRIFSGEPDCGHPDNCPTHHCRLDDAVVHGYCCGCGRRSDRVPVECPPWLKCPLSPIPLCDDYNRMMDCCC